MGKLEKMVDSPAGMEGFRAKYHIPPEVGLEYCSLEEILIKRTTGQVAIPMIAFMEGGLTIPMRRITRDYLHGHRLAPPLVRREHVPEPGVHRCLERSDEPRPFMARRGSSI